MSAKISLSLTGLLAGTIFGLGLSVAQMTDPEKVLGFLDVFGDWDPSLLLTMAGAILTSAIGYRFVLRRGPIFDNKLHLPITVGIDRRLLMGSLIFGLGWGLAGYCPGPAITGFAGGLSEPFVFVAAMLVGSQLERLWLAHFADETNQP